MRIDTLIINADTLTMAGEGVGYVDNAAIAIDSGKIVAVVPMSEAAGYEAEEVIDATRRLVLPGFIDGHMHAGLALFRGLAQDTRDWMMRGQKPYSSRMEKENCLPASHVNMLEALAAGTTTFGEYSFPDQIREQAAFLDKLGARANLTVTIRGTTRQMTSKDINDLYVFDDDMARHSLAENLRLYDEWHGRNDRFTVCLGPQGPDFLSREMLITCKQAATERNMMLHVHLAQGKRETIQMMKRYNMRSIPFMDELGYLDNKLIAAHITDATTEEAQLLARRGASMVLCSGSIGIIDGEVPPAWEFMKAGGYAALGTDQASGNNCNQIINEMKLTALFNKIKYMDPEVLPAWRALRMATIDGARALGLSDRIGSLEPGKQADIIFIDLRAKTMMPVVKQPVRNYVPNLVYSARGNEVVRVMVAGRTLYQDGKYLTVDEETLLDELERSSNEYFARFPLEAVKDTVGYELQCSDRL
ncbi:MAG: amidohydrolase family protein [Oscillospiraceae bacterium]|nr:amidohydrolase family protein [Oscillospiraceae bacterium]